MNSVTAEGVSSLLQAGVVWAGNPIVTDMKSGADNATRYMQTNAPLAMYRGSEDSTMTEWGQLELQAIANRTGAIVELFPVPGVGHTSLFPGGNVSGIPVLNHSYSWISNKLSLQIVDPLMVAAAAGSRSRSGTGEHHAAVSSPGVRTGAASVMVAPTVGPLPWQNMTRLTLMAVSIEQPSTGKFALALSFQASFMLFLIRTLTLTLSLH
jgi:hypothetical protein